MSTPMMPPSLDGGGSRIGTERDPGRIERGAADPRDAERFGNLMRGRDAGGRSTEKGGEGDGQNRADGGNPLPSPFDLFGARATAGSTAPTAPSSPSLNLNEIVETVAERILVSEGDWSRSPEVRIQLKEGILPDTEVRIRQEAGRIVVEFVSGHVDSLRFLEGQRDALLDHLGSRLKNEVEVRVTSARKDSDAGGQPHDGRSREEYLPPPEGDEGSR